MPKTSILINIEHLEDYFNNARALPQPLAQAEFHIRIDAVSLKVCRGLLEAKNFFDVQKLREPFFEVLILVNDPLCQESAKFAIENACTSALNKDQLGVLMSMQQASALMHQGVFQDGRKTALYQEDSCIEEHY